MTQTSAPGASRNTRQRGRILALLEATDEFRTAQQLHADLRSRGDQVGLTTVYRTLQALSEAGEVDSMRTTSGEQLFRRCGRSHHHHLVCRRCNATIEVEGPTVERWAAQLAQRHGFTEVSHTLDVFGTCPRCARRAGDATLRGTAAVS
ncbi:Fur family transcriptional regulator [Luedemannella flava]|uniref:Fur family transcriptional regulator n=1 Tax=Luedemannella flava TaxID=349316 RepID=A0ABP4XS13_9ACTN